MLTVNNFKDRCTSPQEENTRVWVGTLILFILIVLGLLSAIYVTTSR